MKRTRVAEVIVVGFVGGLLGGVFGVMPGWPLALIWGFGSAVFFDAIGWERVQ